MYKSEETREYSFHSVITLTLLKSAWIKISEFKIFFNTIQVENMNSSSVDMIFQDRNRLIL